jgi:hypothetical protein
MYSGLIHDIVIYNSLYFTLTTYNEDYFMIFVNQLVIGVRNPMAKTV